MKLCLHPPLLFHRGMWRPPPWCSPVLFFFLFIFLFPVAGGGRNLYLFIVYKLVYYMAAWSIIPFPVFALIGEEKRGVEIYPVSTGGIVIAQCDLV